MARNAGKGKGGGDDADPLGWLLTFGDMVTLLLTFFVLLLTMASMDDKTFRDAFGMIVAPPEVLSVQAGGGTFINPLPVPRKAAPSETGVATEKDVIVTIEKFLKTTPPGGITRYASQKGVVLHFADGLLFDRHSARLKPEAQALLKRLAREALNDVLCDMIVEGHADRSPLPEDAPFDNHLELTAARALAVTRFLLENSSIPQKQLSCQGRGFRDTDPKRPNDPARNCVELVIDTKIKTT